MSTRKRTLEVVEIDVPRRWDCDSCGFKNFPHSNRRTPEQHAKCEQCGALAPGLETEIAKAVAAGGSVSYA